MYGLFDSLPASGLPTDPVTSCSIGVWAICQFTGKGLGIFALRDIKAGERVMCEEPIATWAVSLGERSSKGEIEVRVLNRMVAALPQDRRTQFFSLCQNEMKYGVKKTTVGVWMSNAFPCDSSSDATAGTVSAAVFHRLSRLNHSCAPNMHHEWNELLGRETLHSLVDIPAGDELTVTYLGDPGTGYERATRQSALLLKFGFYCHCPLCSLRANALAQSEVRQARMKALVVLLEEDTHELPDAEFVRLASERLLLLMQEGLPHCWGHVSMFQSMIRCKKNGNTRAAAQWAARATECARLAFGTDSSSYLLYSHFLGLHDA
jgi:hypothetical protein